MKIIYIVLLQLTAFSLTAQDFEFNYPMVELKAGVFEMGCKDGRDFACQEDEKLHEVEVKGFKIGTKCISQAQFKALMGYNPSHFINCPSAAVDRLTWTEAQEFIKKLNAKTGKKYRLPTEAEWEYAARGGQKSKNFPYASQGIDYSKVESNRGCIESEQTNEIGLYGMSGHFWEWTNSIYRAYPFDNSISPRDGDIISVRGGSWLSLNRAKTVENVKWGDMPYFFKSELESPSPQQDSSTSDKYFNNDFGFLNSITSKNKFPLETRIANRHYVSSDPKDIFGTFSFRLVLDIVK